MRLYPTPSQAAALAEQKARLCELYNAALQERKGAYKRAKKSNTFAEQCRSLTIIRAEHPEHAGVIKRACGDKAAGIDWGVETYATLAHGVGQYAAVSNDRLYQGQEEEAKSKCRVLSKAQRGKKSNNAHKKRMVVARQYAKLANRRKDRAHKLSARLVAEHRLIAMEKLQIVNMTASAKGTVEKPGKMVAQKAGLNREILDTAPGMLMGMIRYKAADAGCELILVNTRRHKPSQTCPACGVVKKKALSERRHACGCGFKASRDEASALHVLHVVLLDYGAGGSVEATPETPSRAA